MDEKRDLTELDQELGDWLRSEQKVAAPTRLVEGVFARTAATQQVRKPLLRWRRTDDKPGRRPTALFAVAALLLIGVVGAGTAGSLLSRPPRALPIVTPVPSVAAVSPSPSAPSLVSLRTFPICHGFPRLTLLRDAAGPATSAWVTCAANSVEVDLATGSVVDRPGLGLIAADGSEQWALKGDSVVKLADDRSILATEQIGSPAAIGVSGTRVFVLDASSGTISAHTAEGPEWSVVPVPGGRLVAMEVLNGSPWVLLQNPGTLFHLDPDNGDVQTTIAVGDDASLLTSAAGALYVTDRLNGTITRIDPATSAKTSFTPEHAPMSRLDSVGGSPDGLLVSSQLNIQRLDPLTGARLGDVDTVPYYPSSVALDGDRMYLATEYEELIEAEAP